MVVVVVAFVSSWDWDFQGLGLVSSWDFLGLGLVSSWDLLKSGAGVVVVVVLLALMRPCTLARNSSRIKTLFFLGPLWDPSWDPSVEALGDGEEASVVEAEVDDEGGDDAVVIPSVEVDTSGVADEAVAAFSLLL